YVLQPPDNRVPMTIRANIAERIHSGAISPQLVYSGFADKDTSIDKEKNQKSSYNTNFSMTVPEEAQNTSADDQETEESSGPVLHTISNNTNENKNSNEWDPEGKTEAKHTYEEIKAACDGSARLGKWPLPSWVNRPSSESVACTSKDVDEEIRRASFDICSTDKQTAQGIKNLGGTKKIWATDVQEAVIENKKASIGQGVILCNNSMDSYRAIFVFRELKNQCWVCSFLSTVQSASQQSELNWNEAKKVLHEVDYFKGPRTSPHESEAPAREKYWSP
ncbi:MAG: hypothetical protein M9962_14050, partial [Oligoflexia bacterium]|nr:hypothetical protein [Oligoflexia bacterium]